MEKDFGDLEPKRLKMTHVRVSGLRILACWEKNIVKRVSDLGQSLIKIGRTFMKRKREWG